MNNLDIEQNVINERDQEQVSQSLSDKYNVDIYTTTENNKIYDYQEINSNLYQTTADHQLDIDQTTLINYFAIPQEYPINTHSNNQNISLLISTILILQIVFIMYILFRFLKVRRKVK